ncbi:recombination protein NinG [Klebsiella pneumoniae]|nr:recombination protein NinG [Klebsiella pneumoniae]
MKTYKPKKCASCGETFTPARNLQKVCGPLCAIAHNRALKQKKSGGGTEGQAEDAQKGSAYPWRLHQKSPVSL